MGGRCVELQQMLDELEMKSLEEIACVLDSRKTYIVSEVRQMLATDDKGRAYQGIDNCMVVMQYDPVLSGAICHNDLTCKIDIVKNLGWGKPHGGGIRNVDVNQIEWYSEQLEWDGVSRIAEMLPKYLGADKCEYTTEVMTLLMKAMIHRIYHPGCKYEIMMCLVGGQGVGKSTLFRLLAIKDEWFSDDLSRLGDDNVYRKLQGHWLIEMPEMLGTVNTKTVEEIKSFLSR